MTGRNRDVQEMLNGLEVARWVEHLTTQPEVPISLDLICFINRLVLQQTDRDYWAGRLRAAVDWQTPEEWSRRRAIVALDQPGLAVVDPETGKLITRFPPDREVGPLLEGLLAWLASEDSGILHPIEKAAIFHHEFTRIHPFRDGNGRTARALMTLILRRAGFGLELFILQQLFDNDRERYLAVLRRADQGDLSEWVLYLACAVQEATTQALHLKKQIASEIRKQTDQDET